MGIQQQDCVLCRGLTSACRVFAKSITIGATVSITIIAAAFVLEIIITNNARPQRPAHVLAIPICAITVPLLILV